LNLISIYFSFYIGDDDGGGGGGGDERLLSSLYTIAIYDKCICFYCCGIYC
jgi:hypothetical protein